MKSYSVPPILLDLRWECQMSHSGRAFGDEMAETLRKSASSIYPPFLKLQCTSISSSALGLLQTTWILGMLEVLLLLTFFSHEYGNLIGTEMLHVWLRERGLSLCKIWGLLRTLVVFPFHGLYLLLSDCKLKYKLYIWKIFF